MYVGDLDQEVQNRVKDILSELEQTFSKIDLGKNGYMFLFNSRHEILVQPKAINPIAADAFKMESSDSILDRLIATSATEGQFLEYSLKPDSRLQQDNRHRRLAAVMHFQPLDWYIVFSMDADEFNAPVRSVMLQVLVLGVVILIGSLLLSLRLSRSLSDPLQRLAAAAQGINFQRIEFAEVPVDGTIETQNLGHVLNSMLASIRKSAQHQEEHFKSDLAAVNQELMQSNQDLQREIEERKQAEETNLRLERKLLQSEKLEAIGRLATGIAHEINTPTQYVNSNVDFLKEAMQNLNTLLENIRKQLDKARKIGRAHV
jgi:C4-dicarboxylate-specific signal transduction histidine kinase